MKLCGPRWTLEALSKSIAVLILRCFRLQTDVLSDRPIDGLGIWNCAEIIQLKSADNEVVSGRPASLPYVYQSPIRYRRLFR
jgi:hypothetical protein